MKWDHRGGTLVQYDWCPYKERRRKQGCLHTQREKATWGRSKKAATYKPKGETDTQVRAKTMKHHKKTWQESFMALDLEMASWMWYQQSSDKRKKHKLDYIASMQRTLLAEWKDNLWNWRKYCKYLNKKKINIQKNISDKEIAIWNRQRTPTTQYQQGKNKKLIKKWARKLNRHFSKDNIQVVNKYMRKDGQYH